MINWLNETCENCTITELNEICKNRGFLSPPPKSGRDSLAEFVKLRLLSEQGLTKTFGSLPTGMLDLLYILGITKKHVNIEELYPFFNISHTWFTNKIYKDAFLKIKKNLVVKGIMLIREDDQRGFYGHKCKWNSYELYFPEEIAKHLPPLALTTVKINTSVNQPEIGKILLGDLFNNRLEADETIRTWLPEFSVAEKKIKFGKKQSPSYSDVILEITGKWLKIKSPKTQLNCTPSQLRRFVLESIPEGYGIIRNDLLDMFKKFACSFTGNEADEFFDAGTALGFLHTVNQDGNEFLVPNLTPQNLDPVIAKNLSETKENISIDSKTRCNLTALLEIAKISDVTTNGTCLCFTPSITKMGIVSGNLNTSDFFADLKSKSSLFLTAWEKVKKRKDQWIVHSNVSVLKLGSMDIKAILLSKSGTHLQELGQDYYAVSNDVLPGILKHAKSHGITPKLLS